MWPRCLTVLQVSFKYEVFWAPVGNGQPQTGVWVKNTGYLPNALNLYTADIGASGIPGDIDALRVNGARAIRARYPNAKTAEQLDAMQVRKSSQLMLGLSRLRYRGAGLFHAFRCSPNFIPTITR